MTALNVLDLWQETALVSITAQSGTDVIFQALTETIDIDLGAKDFDQIVLANGGRLSAYTPETETTITLEAYPLEVGSEDISAATTGSGFFDLLHAEDTTQPLSIDNTRTRNQYRMSVMWTDDTSITIAADAISTGSGYQAIRVSGANGFITSVKPSFTDGKLKFTISFKVSAFDKSGNAQIRLESCDGANTASLLPALASYTSTTKW